MGHIILRLILWFLLTANFGPANIAIGLAIAFLLPREDTRPESIKEWLRIIKKISIAIPVAYIEAFQMLVNPHSQEDVIQERVRPNRSSWLIFLDVFLITFTPKTIVLKYREEGWYDVHQVKPRSLR
jgi:multicomponent Na+:H+ antiporter subunit E